MESILAVFTAGNEHTRNTKTLNKKGLKVENFLIMLLGLSICILGGISIASMESRSKRKTKTKTSNKKGV